MLSLSLKPKPAGCSAIMRATQRHPRLGARALAALLLVYAAWGNVTARAQEASPPSTATEAPSENRGSAPPPSDVRGSAPAQGTQQDRPSSSAGDEPERADAPDEPPSSDDTDDETPPDDELPHEELERATTLPGAETPSRIEEEEEEDDAAADDDDEMEDDDDEDEYPKFEFLGRLITGVEHVETHPTDEQFEEDSRQAFFLEHARVKLRLRFHDRMRATFSANLDSDPSVRSAFVQFEIHDAFEIRAGRFKRPMSRIELRSRRKLPFRERGIFNELVLEDAGWGDRSLGVRFSGEIDPLDLEYYAAVMNSVEVVDVDLREQLRGVDFIGRLEFRPEKEFRMAVNGGHKIIEARIDGPNLHLFAVGADMRIRIDDFRWIVESIAAQNPFPPTPPRRDDRQAPAPWAMNVISYIRQDIELGHDFELQPVALVEWVDTDLDVSEDETLRFLVGLNLLWDDRLRLLPQVEFTRPLGSVGQRSQLKAERYYLMLSAQF